MKEMKEKTNMKEMTNAEQLAYNDNLIAETIAAISFSNSKYYKYSFWSFVIAKMKIQVGRQYTPTAAAGYENGAFRLYINPDFFGTLPLKERIGVLIHESLHIVLQHLERKGERDMKLFNYAADMALNQEIERDMLPKGAIYPDSFKDDKGKAWPDGLTSEVYYSMLKKEQEKQEQEKQEGEGDSGDGDEGQDGDGNGDGQPGEGEGEGQPGEGQGDNGFKPKNGNPNLTGNNEENGFDDHSKWSEMSEEDQELAKDQMGKILENAMEKSRGNAPGNMEKIMELWRRKPVISWKKVLKRYLSTKLGHKESTIKKRDRRQQHRKDLKGKRTRTNVPNVVVGIDTSGSMSDEEIANGLVEIAAVCKLTKSTLKIMQIDTDMKGMEDYDPKKKNFTRKGYGGTYMGAAPEHLMKEKIDCDVLIMLSDMYIEDVAKDTNWSSFKKPVLWLNTSGTDVSWEGLRRHKIMDIHKP